MPIDLATATCADFATTLNETWTLREGDRDYPLTLTQARPLGAARADASREPFALTFHSTQPLRVPQRIYRLEHSRLGTMEPFLVQTAPHEVEAVFA